MARTPDKRNKLIDTINSAGFKAEWKAPKIVVSKDGQAIGKFGVKDAEKWFSKNQPSQTSAPATSAPQA